MKIKYDFVTNSSSVCYIVCAMKVVDEKKLIKFLKNEYGKMGLEIFNEHVLSPDDVLKNFNYDEEDRTIDLPYNDDYSSEETESVKDIILKCKEENKQILFAEESDGDYGPGPATAIIRSIHPDIKKNGLESIYEFTWIGRDG
jgi:hypothetical protein